MKDNIVLEKSYAFAVRTIKCYLHLSKQHKNISDVSRQILRAGTSVGANVEEAVGGYSGKEFHSKFTIAYREARESKYWLRLLQGTELLDAKIAESMIMDADELIKITGSIRKTMSKSEISRVLFVIFNTSLLFLIYNS